jgi:hypothetical protein
MNTREFKMCIILLCLFSSAFPQSVSTFEVSPGLILYADSIRVKEEIEYNISHLKMEVGSENQSNASRGLKYYNLAVCYSTRDLIDSMCYFLCQTLRYSTEYNNLIFTDTDFENLRREPCWDKITHKIDSTYLTKYPDIINKELAVELYHIYLMDQHARGLGLKKVDERIKEIDQKNLRRVEEIILMYGWPTYSLVGETAAKGAFLVIQHSDTQTQQKYFMLIFNAAKNNEASKEWVALLLDRISVHKQGFQYFGTQVYQAKDTITGRPGKYKYFPIQDEANVDSLRKEFGMIPLNEYYSLFGIDYKPVRK